MPDFSGLGDLAKDPAKTKGAWRSLEPADLGEGKVLAFDQSLTATGWVAVTSGNGIVDVTRAGTVADGWTDMPKGVERDLRRGVAVFEQSLLLVEWARDHGYRLSHESPPNPSQVKGGGTGSLMGAVAVRSAVAVYDRHIEMLGAQPAKKIVCGNGNADKKAAHAALKEYCFTWIGGSDLVTNEATRDALMNALLWLYRQPK